MRPIDADALCERLSEKALTFSFVDDCTECTVRDDIQMVQEAITLDYKDLVPQGEWINHEGYDECALCGTKAIYEHNFCPNCGARMVSK